MMPDILKVDIIQDAYSQATISGLTKSPTPEDLELALTRLEGMAAEFEGRNMCVGWNFTELPDPADVSGISLEFRQAFATNLATRILGDFGKAPSATLALQATQSASNLAARTAQIRETPYPSRQPRGSGNTVRWNRWTKFYGATEQAPQACATIELQVGEVNDYSESWADYLKLSETIVSYTKIVTNGLTVTNDVLVDSTEITYRAKATIDGYQAIEFTVTTSDGRVDIRTVNFDITPSAVDTPNA